MISLLKRVLRQGTRLCKDFGADRAGNFALMTIPALFVIASGAGFAVDYSNLSRVRAGLQNSLDSAALAVAQKGKKISNAEAQQIAREYLAGNLPMEFKSLQVIREDQSVTVSANVDVNLFFGHFLGKDKMAVGAVSKADVALISYEIALVLDTTGSMRGRKLRDMKNAVKNLIDNISDQVNDPERLRFALVPFSAFVNVGPQYAPKFDKKGKMIEGTGAAWLDLEGASEIPQLELKTGISRFQAYHNLGYEWKGCVETRMRDGDVRHDVADTAVDPRDPATLFVPSFAIDEPRYYSNDYINSSVNPWDTGPLATKAKLEKYGFDLLGGVLDKLGLDLRSGGYGPNYMCDSEPLTPLTNDYRLLKKKVNKFKAKGNTNVMEGVAWGSRVLSQQEPFAGGDPENGLIKIMVVLTDGANTFGVMRNQLRSRYSSFGYMIDGRLDGEVNASSSKSTLLMNDKTLEACQFAKKSGIDIYTIRLEVRDTGTGSMMRSCASRPDQYFDTPSSRQLKNVFEKIGEQIVRLRLST